MRAAPDRSGAMAGASWLMPSGKISTAPPRRSAAVTERNASALRSAMATPCALSPSSLARRRGTTPTASNNAESAGFSNSVALAVSSTRRDSVVPTSNGSMSAFGWFATMSSGPVRGARSAPCATISA